MRPARAKRIGLFGGSFDPVHNAHRVLARCALDALALDELRWVPAGRPWQKGGTVATALQRLEMVRLAIAGEPRFCVEPCEIVHDGPSYTIDTVLALQTVTPAAQWFLLIGQDQLARFHTWHRWQELATLATLAVASRAGDPVRVPPELSAAAVPLIELPMPAMPISSTEIRARRAAGQAIDALVPVAVARYIDTHGLYRDPLRS